MQRVKDCSLKPHPVTASGSHRTLDRMYSALQHSIRFCIFTAERDQVTIVVSAFGSRLPGLGHELHTLNGIRQPAVRRCLDKRDTLGEERHPVGCCKPPLVRMVHEQGCPPGTPTE
jgi:hypothetical protein